MLPLLRHDSSHFVDGLVTSVLLNGPSGCGKRTVALAVARDACAVFIDARAALDCWHGPAAEGMTLVWAVTQALQPAVVYVDGVESMLGVLRSTRAAAAAAAPSRSVDLGRGYSGTSGNDIVLIGATKMGVTNLDAGVAGQFELQCSVAAPGAAEREALLTRFLFQECRRMNWKGLSIDLWKGNGQGTAGAGRSAYAERWRWP